MKKLYGKCGIVGCEHFENELKFEMLVEFVYRNNGEVSAVGKDIITGTPIYSLPVALRARNLYDAADRNKIKKGKLLASYCMQISEKELLETLEAMDKDDLEKYINTISDLKEKYSQALINAKASRKNARENYRTQSESIKTQKRRIRRLIGR